ncbi:MAG: MFS transporter [Pirellulales bacterium]|nr:MFS transporter [Pirellulales bacterium]
MPADATVADETELLRQVSAREPWNTLVLESYQIVLRIGWIFKTESIIIPAVLDVISDNSGWLRGCLPVINRFGQSVPPVFYSRRLSTKSRKKWALFSTTMVMAACFLALGFAWGVVGDHQTPWMATLFLVLYGIFSSVNGLNMLALGTLQGKLVSVTRRGRAMLISTAVGAALAIAFAWWLMGRWLELPHGGFGYIFSFTGVLFVLAALCAPLFDEPHDQYNLSVVHMAGHFRGAWQIFREDANFRRLAGVAVLFGVVLILFPHYQALGRIRLGLTRENLMLWVIVQNAGAGAFSILAGPLADRRGNRLVLSGLLLATATTPVLAALLGNAEPTFGKSWYWLVFLPLGLTPLTMKTLSNYTLEICGPADHPRYLAALGLSLGLPFVLSPLVGWLIDATSFEVVFLGGAILIVAGGVVSFGLHEPRDSCAGELTVLPGVPED